MAHNELWRRWLGHDGYFVATLRLLRVEDGGRNRVVQSGYRASWWLPGSPWGDEGPIEIIGTRKGIKPGCDAPVKIFPLHPSLWSDITIGQEIRLARPSRRQGRQRRSGPTVHQPFLGVGVITERHRVPLAGGDYLHELASKYLDRQRTRGSVSYATLRRDEGDEGQHEALLEIR